jgi:ABC-2 type transport system ATP-binding protein
VTEGSIGHQGERPIPLAIETDKLTRYYNDRCAVDQVTLRVPEGCVYGLLGPNGSGKTTTIKMLLGLLKPTRGSARLLGHESQRLPPRLRDRIGYVAEGHELYRSASIADLAKFQSAFFSRWNGASFRQMLDHFRLLPNQRIRQLSNGQRAQVSLALTLACEPDLLVMDDPTLGVDPVIRRRFLESMIQLINQKGRTVLFSSHVLADVERVAQRIGILTFGVLRVDCTLAEFKAKLRRVQVVFDAPVPSLLDLPGLVWLQATGRESVLTIAHYDGTHEAALRMRGARRIEPLESTLEDLFIDYNSGGPTQFVSQAGVRR